jgi:nucleotidyltransferase/DNA polymerase involved in DNA repair
MAPRAILHVDMDAFHAAVEQRDRAELAPASGGADPRGRGVVSAASYAGARDSGAGDREGALPL